MICWKGATGVTKAQLLVWAVIAGLLGGGGLILSRVTLPDGRLETATVVTPPAAQAKRAVLQAPVAGAAAARPAVIPQFPFPDIPAAGVDAEAVVTLPEAASAVPEIPAEAVPDIAAVIEPEEPAPEPAEAPPIPAAARPRAAARPVEETTLYVAAPTLNVRAAPSTDGAILQKLRMGFAIAPNQRSDEWIGFIMKDGSTGWLRTEFLSTTKPAVMAAQNRQEQEPLNLM
jgi:hypothetical protein